MFGPPSTDSTLVDHQDAVLSAHAPSSPSDEPDTKRRKLRKGTRSCWDCKRRKVRCNFASASDEKCVACFRRDVSCVSQDLPEEFCPPQEARGANIGHLESLLGQLVKKVAPLVAKEERQSVSAERSPQGPAALKLSDQFFFSQHERSPNPPPQAQGLSRALAGGLSGEVPILRDSSKLRTLSQGMIAAFPSIKDLGLIFESGTRVHVHAYDLCVKRYADLENEDELECCDTLHVVPDASVHPVLIAKQMILLALYLQQQPPRRASSMLEPPQIIAKRLVEAASGAVTTNESFHGTIESLECMMLESMFHIKYANLRRSWFASRRALSVAQMMGINRARTPPLKSLEPSQKLNPAYTWLRLVWMDRLLSLLLGLPHCTPDRSIVSEAALANDTPVGRFERHLAANAGRILERNEAGFNAPDCFALTHSIDAAMLKAAQAMPDEFWVIPPFSDALTQDEAADAAETSRAIHQLLHYSLLNALHLPYLLAFDERGKHEYSQTTCINSSREVLARFVSYRKHHMLTACRPADFFGLMAGMILLLAHVHSHRCPARVKQFSHQRLGDRAALNQLVATMALVASANEDVVAAKSTSLLERLLRVESEAAQGHVFRLENLGVVSGPVVDVCPDLMHISIPYFGVIRIAREGTRAADAPPVVCPNGTKIVPALLDVSAGAGGETAGPGTVPAAAPQRPQAPAEVDPFGLHSGNGVEGAASQAMQSGRAAELDGWAVDVSLASYPELTADVDDWAFQGVDLAFFDSLMRGSGGGEGMLLNGWQQGDLAP